MKIDGGCRCGYITYEAEADPGHEPKLYSIRVATARRRAALVPKVRDLDSLATALGHRPGLRS
jgi:hypothetical protein